MISKMHQEQIDRIYQKYLDTIPEVNNLSLDRSLESKEYLIYCSCNRLYRVFINDGIFSLSEGAKGVLCPYCNASIDRRTAAGMHSGGCFNATVIHAPDLGKIKKVKYE